MSGDTQDCCAVCTFGTRETNSPDDRWCGRHGVHITASSLCAKFHRQAAEPPGMVRETPPTPTAQELSDALARLFDALCDAGDLVMRPLPAAGFERVTLRLAQRRLDAAGMSLQQAIRDTLDDLPKPTHLAHADDLYHPDIPF